MSQNNSNNKNNMIKDISFSSLTEVPSDRDCADGQLALSLNLINEDGTLKPISRPTSRAGSIVALPNAQAVIAAAHKVMHGSDMHTHLIVNDRLNGKWAWTEVGGRDRTLHYFSFSEAGSVNVVTAIGNFLCFVADDNIIYALWQNDRYTMFSSDAFAYSASLSLSDIPSSPTVKQTFDEDTFKAFFTSGKDGAVNLHSATSATGTRAIYNALQAELNRKAEEYGDTHLHGKMLGVCAVRLYDGSYVNVSMPFVIDGRVSNEVYYYGDDNDAGYDKFTVAASGTWLYYAYLTVNMDVATLTNVVAGIDVFLTLNDDFVDADTVCLTSSIDQHQFSNGKFKIPFLLQDKACERIDRMTFYKSVSIDKNDFGSPVFIKKVTGTETHLSLADMRAATLGAKVGTAYNSRLHLADVSTMLSGKTVEYVLQPFAANSSIPITWQHNSLHNAVVKGTVQGRSICLAMPVPYPLPSIIAVPVNNLTEARLYVDTEATDSTKRYLCIPLNMHSSASFGMSFYTYISRDSGSMTGPPASDDYYTTSGIWQTIEAMAQDKVLLSRSTSLVKVSEAENPIVFPAKNSVQVGSATIKALAANTQPISEGQFGSAPLYAFTDEGVWVLMTSDQGTYQARQPANRNVCSNVKGILQTDDAVLFPTTRGIMMQQGRTSVCITDAIKTSRPLRFAEFCGNDIATQITAFSGIDDNALFMLPFEEFMTDADMVYSYADARVFLFNPRCAYAYVYSLKTGGWGTAASSLQSRVNIYPEALAVDKNLNVVDITQSTTAGDIPYLICTRPLALSSPDVFKAVRDIAARGFFDNTEGKKCATVLFASNDLFRWHLVASSQDQFLHALAGSPYKFFRVACTGTLDAAEAISGITVQFAERRTNRLR